MTFRNPGNPGQKLACRKFRRIGTGKRLCGPLDSVAAYLFGAR